MNLLNTRDFERFRPAPEEDKFKQGFNDPDYLGLYFNHHPNSHYYEIVLCPEKIFLFAESFARRYPGVEPWKAGVLYEAFFRKVAMHELAHAFMDPHDAESSGCRYRHSIEEGSIAGRNLNFEERNDINTLNGVLDSQFWNHIHAGPL